MFLPQKIILIGFMGSGKSTLAALLAKELSYRLIDADEEVVKISQYKSIREIILTVNEEHFRDLESKVCESLRDVSSVVIATGGGVIGREANMIDLQQGESFVVFLDTSLAEVKRRIPDRSSRPIFHDLEVAERTYTARLPVYRGYANLIVNTDGRQPLEICSHIIREISTLKGEK